MSGDVYIPPEESHLTPGEWLKAEGARLERLGLESGQRLLCRFDRDPKKDTVEVLERFERPEQ